MTHKMSYKIVDIQPLGKDHWEASLLNREKGNIIEVQLCPHCVHQASATITAGTKDAIDVSFVLEKDGATPLCHWAKGDIVSIYL